MGNFHQSDRLNKRRIHLEKKRVKPPPPTSYDKLPNLKLRFFIKLALLGLDIQGHCNFMKKTEKSS